MAYFTPYIDNLGLHVPTYQDIIDYYVAKAKEIFGADIYLGPDSQDYQMYSIIARAAAASLQAAVDSYNARDPDTAFDDVLDGLVTINGIQRKPSTYSTVSVTLTGIPYTLITGGVIQSISGEKWNLPNEVVLDGNGTALVTATAQEKGAITALPNTLTGILTPTYGWYSVTNLSEAYVGQAAETTPALKARRKIAVATPSQTPLEGLSAAILNILGVTDHAVYENDTKETDERGLPGNSITVVVAGGSNEDIANAIAKEKNMGVLSYGNVTLPVRNEYGSLLDISFFRPELVDVYIQVNIVPRNGYTTLVGQQIQEAINSYFTNLRIGDNLYSTQLYESALSVSPDIKPYFSISPTAGITVGTSAGNLSKQDLIATFKQKFQTEIDNITINIVNS
jgi:uncharacterized phage protein gp47/JayE